ncbi:MAG: alkaline phosphatase family protein [Bacteroidaceae bacterium]|nr:alkaline phosphatase family protein [Bacteroidaceae bacterium]
MRIKSFLTALLCCASFASVQENISSPKLYLNIVVDQLRTDFMYEFSGLYGDGGFKRLLAGGCVYPNSYYAFENVDRASAMATLMTGTNPYVNGIVGERWFDRKTLRTLSCVEDKSYKGLYSISPYAPTRLNAITITDEMKRASRGKAIVCAIAPDEDAAVISGGHAPDAALWKNNSAGFWSSSTYYGVYPQWAADMNKKVQGRSAKWEPMLDKERYNHFGEKAASFSYSFDGKNKVRTYKTTACMNDEVVEMALAFLKESDAGKDNIADCLSLTFYAGNIDGRPMEQRPLEIQDIYARLDKSLETLFGELDKSVGMENVVVSLSSTGYVMVSGDDGAEYRLPSGTIYMERVKALLDVYLGAIFGKGEYVEGVYGPQLYFDNGFIENQKLDKLDVISRSVEFLKSLDGVEDVFSIYHLGGNLSPELQYVKNGYNQACSGDVWLRLMPGWKVAGSALTLTNEVYRTPIMFPIIIYGSGIEHEVVEAMTPANVLAGEMARILHIRRPNDNCLRVF